MKGGVRLYVLMSMYLEDLSSVDDTHVEEVTLSAPGQKNRVWVGISY